MSSSGRVSELSLPRFVNCGSASSPELQVFLNLGTLVDLPDESLWNGFEGLERDRRLQSAGFDGIQLTMDGPPGDGSPLPHCGLDRINVPDDADAVVAKHAFRGDICLTVHAGWGTEDDDEVFRLVESILIASARRGLPVFVETHRATITQDIWRTVQIVKKFPEIRFNADFSHYYCGQELVYGNWENRLAFMTPIFERIGFIHGRVASSGCMQVPIDNDLDSRPQQAHGTIDYLAHFRQLWTLAMLGFLRSAGTGDVMIFAPELLPGTHYYARLFPDQQGRMAEESDRYAQALLLKRLAEVCFADALTISSSERVS